MQFCFDHCLRKTVFIRDHLAKVYFRPSKSGWSGWISSLRGWIMIIHGIYHTKSTFWSCIIILMTLMHAVHNKTTATITTGVCKILHSLIYRTWITRWHTIKTVLNKNGTKFHLIFFLLCVQCIVVFVRETSNLTRHAPSSLSFFSPLTLSLPSMETTFDPLSSGLALRVRLLPIALPGSHAKSTKVRAKSYNHK